MLKVSLLPLGKELNVFGVKGGGGFLTELSQGSWVEETCELATVEWASRLPHR